MGEGEKWLFILPTEIQAFLSPGLLLFEWRCQDAKRVSLSPLRRNPVQNAGSESSYKAKSDPDFCFCQCFSINCAIILKVEVEVAHGPVVEYQMET